MESLSTLSKDYDRIETAIRFLADHYQEQPALSAVASRLGLSESHFQKTFQRWAGVSPKRFVQFLTKEHAKRRLQNSSLLDVSYDSGLSGPGRLHDLFVACEAMSPGEYKARGRGLVIEYGFHPTPFGECFIAVTARGICALIFLSPRERDEVVADLTTEWANARIRSSTVGTAPYIGKIFPASRTSSGPLHLLCRGTNFQIKVWEALLRIPMGQIVTYQDIARGIGQPGASRAVGHAVGQNPVSYLIPCHRVIRATGQFGNYGGGIMRKRAMLAWEAARAGDTTTAEGDAGA